VRHFNLGFVESYDGADNPEAWARASNPGPRGPVGGRAAAHGMSSWPRSAGKDYRVRIDRLLPPAIHSALQFLVAV